MIGPIELAAAVGLGNDAGERDDEVVRPAHQAEQHRGCWPDLESRRSCDASRSFGGWDAENGAAHGRRGPVRSPQSRADPRAGRASGIPYLIDLDAADEYFVRAARQGRAEHQAPDQTRAGRVRRT